MAADVHSQWRIFTSSKSEIAAKRVHRRVVEALGYELFGFQLVPNANSGEYIFSFDLRVKCQTRNDCIVALLEVGQTLGYEWTLFGDIRENFSAWSTKPKVVGVKALQWGLAEGIEQDDI